MYEILQIYWWFIVSLLGGLLAFMIFVQGGQTLMFCLKKDDLETYELQKDMIIASIGKKWELTFTTLVMFGGACFAAFPLFYATSFGGAYWVWLAILFCFIIQAVSYEYRKKPNNFLGQKTYEYFLLINGSVGIFLIGVALSTFFSGSHFMLNEHNFVQWEYPLRGLEALFNPLNFILGIALVFCARVGGSLYLINNINNEDMRAKFRKLLVVDSVFFLLFFVLFLVWICLKDGFAYDENGKVFMQNFKYSLNFIQMPLVGLELLIGVVLVIIGIYMGIFTKSIRGIFAFGVGVVLAVNAVLLCVGLNSTAFYPSVFDLQSSLTIKNASSSFYTLKVMGVVSILVPFVLCYIIYVWRAMDSKKLDIDEIKNSSDGH